MKMIHYFSVFDTLFNLEIFKFQMNPLYNFKFFLSESWAFLMQTTPLPAPHHLDLVQKTIYVYSILVLK